MLFRSGARFFWSASPAYVGYQYVHMHALQTAAVWGRLTDCVRTGAPARDPASPDSIAFWSALSPLIARAGAPVADAAIEALGLCGDVPCRLLDIGGGGRALYSRALLVRNARATAVQLDYERVNVDACYAIGTDCAERFSTLDGTLETLDVTAREHARAYDVCVLSNVLHLLSPAECVAALRRVAALLREGGRVLVSEFVVDDGRAGPAHALLFGLNMLAMTRGGAAYREGDIGSFLSAAGFLRPSVRTGAASPMGPQSTLFIATLAA